MLEKVIENWTSRLDYIRASRGSPMPEIIFKMEKLRKHLSTSTTAYFWYAILFSLQEVKLPVRLLNSSRVPGHKFEKKHIS
ncbi:hypothetical protein TNCV_327551 [Trichonephila clavipes]|nr:hypothetical protein TNCV_327551 [Trichonephila clavipes]